MTSPTTGTTIPVTTAAASTQAQGKQVHWQHRLVDLAFFSCFDRLKINYDPKDGDGAITQAFKWIGAFFAALVGVIPTVLHKVWSLASGMFCCGSSKAAGTNSAATSAAASTAAAPTTAAASPTA